MKKFECFILLIVCGMISLALTTASHSGAQDRSFLVYQAETQKYVSVTERTIRSNFPIAPINSKCDMMGICIVDGKTMLDSEKFDQ